MEEKKKETRGGARAGTGPKQIRKKPNRKTITLSDQVLNDLNYYSKWTGINFSELANSILFLGIDSQQFVHCPKCGKPSFYIPLLPMSGLCDFECVNCGHEFKQEI